MEQQSQNKKSRKPLIILAIVFFIMVGAGTYYWIRSAAFETTDDAQLDGNIFSVRSGVTAYLNRICFQDNQHVDKGDTLFIFDTIALKAEVQKAQAALANAKTKMSVSDIQALASQQNANASFQNALSQQGGITAAKAQFENTKKVFSRDEALIKINAITQVQYDADKTMLAQNKAAYEQAVHNQKSTVLSASGLSSQAAAAHHQISATAALVAQCEAEVHLAEEKLSHAFVLAPCNGIATKRAVDQGQYVLAGQSLCAVVDEQNLWVSANFKETQLQKIRAGQPVSITVDAFPNISLEGVVQSFGGATGAKFALIPPDNATGNFIKVTQRFPLRIKIKQTKQITDQDKKKLLFPGLSVFVKIKTK